MQRHQHQFHTGEEPKTERDPKTDLLSGHSQKARKQEQEKNEANLHDADRALQSGEDVHQQILSKEFEKATTTETSSITTPAHLNSRVPMSFSV